MKISHVFGFILSISPIDCASVMKKDGGHGNVKIFGHARDLKKIHFLKNKNSFLFQNPF